MLLFCRFSAYFIFLCFFRDFALKLGFMRFFEAGLFFFAVFRIFRVFFKVFLSRLSLKEFYYAAFFQKQAAQRSLRTVTIPV